MSVCICHQTYYIYVERSLHHRTGKRHHALAIKLITQVISKWSPALFWRLFGDHLLHKEAKEGQRETVMELNCYFGATIWLLVMIDGIRACVQYRVCQKTHVSFKPLALPDYHSFLAQYNGQKNYRAFG